MIYKHPLTNKKLFKKFWDHTVDVTTEVLYTPDGIRAAADWQLAQCLNYIRLTYGDEAMIPFMEEMRPTKKCKR